MIDFSELEDINLADISSWPIWFRWAMSILVAVGILAGGYKFLIEPEQQALTRLEDSEQQLRTTFLAKKKLVVNLPAYQAQMLEIRDRFGVVLKQLPNQTEVPELLIDISQAGLARGLKFQQFKPSDPRTDEFYITLPIAIVVTGRFHQLAEFISDLASLPRIVTLGDMNISRGADQELVMKADLFTYQYPEENADQTTDAEEQVSG